MGHLVLRQETDGKVAVEVKGHLDDIRDVMRFAWGLIPAMSFYQTLTSEGTAEERPRKKHGPTRPQSAPTETGTVSG